jgi:hypothetical protein
VFRAGIISATRWPAIVASPVVGLLMVVGVDLGLRAACRVGGNGLTFWPRTDCAEFVRVNTGPVRLYGLGFRCWAWSHLDMGPNDFLSDQTRAESDAMPRESAGAIVSKYGMAALADTRSLDARTGETPDLRSTTFGFPFRTSTREVVSGVEASGPPAASGLLRVRVRSGWIWSPEASSMPIMYRSMRAQRDWVYPAGIAGDTVLAAAALLLGRAACFAVRGAFRVRRGRCVHCAYDLHGLVSGSRCPECGRGGG